MLHTMLGALSPMILMWLVALIIFAVAEAVTVALVSVWFCGGALAALIAAGLGGPLWLQVALFLVVSGVLLAVVAPLARKASRAKPVATNADRHVGKVALVTEDINNLAGTGAIKLDGVVWTARAEDDSVIPVGEKIVVTRIAGSKAYVKPAEVLQEV